jgi:hypothetical protein
MPKNKRGKPMKMDAAFLFGGGDKERLARAPAQRDDDDDGLSRFPDRKGGDRDDQQSGGFGEARGDGDDNWRGGRVKQPARDDRNRPSNYNDGDGDNDWRGGGRAQPQFRDDRDRDRDGDRDRDPNAPQVGRSDQEESWGRGTAKQPSFEFRDGGERDPNGPMRSDTDEAWGRGTAKVSCVGSLFVSY